MALATSSRRKRKLADVSDSKEDGDNSQTTIDNLQTTTDNLQTTTDNLQITTDNLQITSDNKLADKHLADNHRDKPTRSSSKASKGPTVKLSRATSTAFFDLPTEIRAMIHKLVLLPSEGTHIVLRTREKDSRPSAVKEALKYNVTNHRCSSLVQRQGKATNRYAILAVSRNMHNDAVQILYAQPLCFKHPSTLVHFLAQIGLSNRSLLRDVTLMAWNGLGHGRTVNKAAFSMLADSAKSLRRLRIDAHIKSDLLDLHGDTRHKALATAHQIFRETLPFLEAIGRVYGAKDAALDLIDLTAEAYSWNVYVGKIFPRMVRQVPSGDEHKAMEGYFKEELRRLLLRGR